MVVGDLKAIVTKACNDSDEMARKGVTDEKGRVFLGSIWQIPVINVPGTVLKI